MKFKIGIAQTSVSADKQRNLKYANEAVEELGRNGADFVVLPEMFNCPYSTEYFRGYSEKAGGAFYSKISEIAAKNKVYLIAGSIPEQDEAGRIYNTSFVFDRNGNELCRHRKMHLFDISVEGGQHFRESDTFTAGNQVTVFSTEYGVMGLCICYDFRFPELARLMVLKGAKVIFVPAAFNMTTGPAHWEILFRQRAVENQVYTVGAAPARVMDSVYVSYGNSMAVSPWGTVLARLNENEGLALFEADMDELSSIRQQLPLLQHRRADIYKVTNIKKENGI